MNYNTPSNATQAFSQAPNFKHGRRTREAEETRYRKVLEKRAKEEFRSVDAPAEITQTSLNYISSDVSIREFIKEINPSAVWASVLPSSTDLDVDREALESAVKAKVREWDRISSLPPSLADNPARPEFFVKRRFIKQVCRTAKVYEDVAGKKLGRVFFVFNWNASLQGSLPVYKQKKWSMLLKLTAVLERLGYTSREDIWTYLYGVLATRRTPPGLNLDIPSLSTVASPKSLGYFILWCVRDYCSRLGDACSSGENLQTKQTLERAVLSPALACAFADSMDYKQSPEKGRLLGARLCREVSTAAALLDSDPHVVAAYAAASPKLVKFLRALKPHSAVADRVLFELVEFRIKWKASRRMKGLLERAAEFLDKRCWYGVPWLEHREEKYASDDYEFGLVRSCEVGDLALSLQCPRKAVRSALNSI